ncbi:MAG: AEC family transporter [Phyllobacteriaceae bacterium]|nr:AEC family transporter [Phyllobacteriaceae bacterium]
MTAIFLVTGPIFLLIALGFATARTGLLSRSDFAALGKFVVNLALPALLFLTLARRPLADTVNVPYMAAYLAGGVALVLLASRFLHRMAGLDVTGAAIAAMGMACPNSGFVGYPILLALYPDLAGTVLALNMAVENLAIIPLALFLAERGRHAGQEGAALKRAFSSLARSPLMLAIVAGALWSLAGLDLPALLIKPLDMLAAASGAASLLVIGGSLAQAGAGAFRRDALLVAAGKLVAHPVLAAVALAGFAALGFGIADERLRIALVVSAAMPIMGIYPLLAHRFGRETPAAVALVTTTALSLLTVNALFVFIEFARF